MSRITVIGVSWHAWRVDRRNSRVILAQRTGSDRFEMIGVMDNEQVAATAVLCRNAVERLGDFILNEIPGEPSKPEDAVETAIRLLREAQSRRDPWYSRLIGWLGRAGEVELTGRD